MRARERILADLEELDANLPGRRVEGVEFAGGADDDALDVVGRFAVGEDDDV